MAWAKPKRPGESGRGSTSRAASAGSSAWVTTSRPIPPTRATPAIVNGRPPTPATASTSRRAGHPADPRDAGARERPPDPAGDGEPLARRGLERLQPAGDHLAHPVGHQGGELGAVPQLAALGEQADELAHEERVAGGQRVKG